jgi:predicted PurR-regulated permease PerM
LIDKLKKPWRNVVLALLVVLVGWFCWTIRSVLNPLILGYLLAYVAHPAVLKLEKRGLSRRSAVNVIFVGTGLAAALVLFLIFLQGRSLVNRLNDPELYDRTWGRLERELDQHSGMVEWITARLPGADEPAADEPAADEPVADEPVDGAKDAGDTGDEQETAASAAAGDEAEAADAADREAGDEAAGVAPADDEPRSAVGELRAALEEWGAALLADENMSQTRDTGLAWAGVVLAFLQRLFGSILAFGTLLVLLPIYTYFLLFELERIHRFVRHYMPAF